LQIKELIVHIVKFHHPILILDLISMQQSGCQLLFAFNLESIVVKILLASAYLLEYVFHYAKRAPSHENNC